MDKFLNNAVITFVNLLFNYHKLKHCFNFCSKSNITMYFNSIFYVGLLQQAIR